jgi:hypothetical protein
MRYSRELLGVAAVALLVGCGAPSTKAEEVPTPTSRANVPGLVEPTCLAANLLGFSDLPQAAAPVPEPRPIPADFVPVRVVTCEGDWSAGVVEHSVSWVEERREGNMDAVIAGYRLPSDAPPEVRTCFVDQPTPPIVWLVDDQGLGLLAPDLPTDACGGYKWDAITVIRALPVTERIVHLIPVSPTIEARFVTPE